jgi:hypothetical protein
MTTPTMRIYSKETWALLNNPPLFFPLKALHLPHWLSIRTHNIYILLNYKFLGRKQEKMKGEKGKRRIENGRGKKEKRRTMENEKEKKKKEN